jgi:hypothetical protein
MASTSYSSYLLRFHLFLKEQQSFLYVGEICSSHGRTEVRIVVLNQNTSSCTIVIIIQITYVHNQIQQCASLPYRLPVSAITAIIRAILYNFFLSLVTYNNNNNNNNNNNKLQLGYHPVAVVILHVYKTRNRLLLNLSREGYMRSI